MNSLTPETAYDSMLNIINRFRASNNLWVSLTRDLLFVAGMIVLFMLISQIALGTPRPAVAVESGSMLPNIGIGDVVIIQSFDKTSIHTYEAGLVSGYKSFDNYGDVILYRKYGSTTETPIIHRAMYWVDEGEPMWVNGPLAPHSGYITKGDNQQTNIYVDQATDTSRLQPIKEEWIIGVARWHIPWLGYISLAVH
jgi:signal peptidase